MVMRFGLGNPARAAGLGSLFGLLVAAAPAQPESGKRNPADGRPGRGGLLHLKVDVAAPRGEGSRTPIAGTARDGWWPWVIPDWDFYRTDLVWEDGSQRYPAKGPGIAGSGVHAAISCNYEGIMTLHVAGMRRYLAGGIKPEKKPIHDPLCNTWIAASDFPNNPSSDLLLGLYGLPAGTFRLVSYHNCFNGRRIGDNPTGVEYTGTREPEPPMSSIRVYSIKTIGREYFDRPAEPGKLPKGRAHGTSQSKIVVPGLEGTGKVSQTKEATRVVIQQVKADAGLNPSVIEFATDGSPLVVVYAGGSGKRDDLRPHRRGGYAVLNAFELIQLSAPKPR